MLLKKVESLQTKTSELLKRWDELRAENDRLHIENDRLTTRLGDFEKKLEIINGKKKELEVESATNGEFTEELRQCREEVERNLELLRKYRNGI